MPSLLGYLQLLRPVNCLMTSAAVFAGGILILKTDPAGLLWGPLLLAMLIAFIIAGAGNAVNDYVDVDVDRVNKPRRPIPSGRVSRRGTLVFSLVLFVVGVLLAGFISGLVLLIALFNSILLIAYSTSLQNKMLMGNIAISYLVGSGFLFGGAALGNFMLPLLLLMLAGFANISREIVKDLEDMEGDKSAFLRRLTSGIKEQTRTIADRFGISSGNVKLKHTDKLAVASALSLALAIAVSPAPFMLGILGFSYLVILVPTDIVFLVCIFSVAKASGKRGYGRVSKGIKLGMMLGLAAFIVGVLL